MMNAEDLKNSILQMAMQGKLVPQNSEDEPASVLLEKIKKEKEELIKEKKIKRNNKESIIWKENGHWYEKIGKKGETKCIDEEIRFKIPKNWYWTRLGTIISVSSGKNLTSKKMDENFEIPVYGGNGIAGYYNNFNIKEKKIIIGRVGANCGNVHISSDKAWVTDNAFITTYPQSYLDMKFLKYMLIYMDLRSYSNSTAQPVISGKKIYPLLLQLPPLNEQKRIVEKLEQILPQIEQYGKYEEQLTKLNQEFPEKLKKSILQQAVQGKLVPQNPEDEPASVLLEKIKQEKEQLIKDGKIKRNKNESTIYKKDGHWYEVIDRNNEVKCIDEEIPFEIPENWIILRVGNVGDWKAGSTPKRGESKYYSGGTIPWLKTGDLNDSYINRIPENITKLALKETSVRLNPVGSVLMAMYGATIGKLGILNIEATTNQACCACIPFKGINSEFLLYYLMSERQNFINMGEGGAQPNISRTKIINKLMILPPEKEQKRIVEKIEQILPKIEHIFNNS